MDNVNFFKILKSNSNMKYLINNKYSWEFLDEYTFSEFQKEKNSPSYFCEAEGNVYINNQKKIAKMIIMNHKDLNMMSGILYLKEYIEDDNQIRIVNITSIEEM